MQLSNYHPQHPHLCKVWEQLTEVEKQKRLAEAIRREVVLKKIIKRVESGKESERAAVKRLFTEGHRSSYRRWFKRYKAHGLDGLFDWRLALKRRSMPAEVRTAICTLRRAESTIAVEKIVEHIIEHQNYMISATTVKRVLRAEGLARRRGRIKGDKTSGERHLELGGVRLVEGAIIETGYVKTMLEGLSVHIAEAIGNGPFLAPKIDTSDRDEYGRFLPSYNERYRKSAQDVIGPGFASVEEKRRDKDPARYHISGASLEVLERKFLALLYSPLLGSGRWDGIRVSRGNLLEELCGYAYMPSTLDLFTRELKFMGAASTLWEIHARLWYEKTKSWGEPGRQAVIFIDGTDKPAWTRLYSQATLVSSVGRVMPGLELVCFHSGYGVPLWVVTHSGRAPLVKVVPSLLGQLEDVLGGFEAQRIIVIDAEGNSIDFLKGLERGAHARAWITRLRPSMVEGKRIFNRTNYRSYRDGDRVRMGLCDFNDPDGELFRMRVVEVERRGKNDITYLGASMLLDDLDWAAQDVADLYFERWPMQEANFRAVNQAVGFKEIHGNGKQLVDNVSVVTKLDKLEKRVTRLDQQSEKLSEQIVEQTTILVQQEKALGKLQSRFETVDRQLAGQLKPGKVVTKKISALSSERKKLSLDVAQGAEQVQKTQQTIEETTKKCLKFKNSYQKAVEQREDLESRRHIFKHDVDLDSLFSLLKVGLVLLVTYVLKEYLGDARMEPMTFLERLATLPARQRLTPDVEIITFEYNERDPDIMALLAEHCESINARRLRMRSGRILRIKVEPAPIPWRPPPAQRRVMPGDRFRRN